MVESIKNKGIYKEMTEIFDLFYNSVRGITNCDNLNEEEILISAGIKNEFCLGGKCYKIYKEIKRLNKSNRTQELINLYEQILKIMCQEMFSHGIYLGYISKLENKKIHIVKEESI